MTIRLRVRVDTDEVDETLEALELSREEGRQSLARALDRMGLLVQRNATLDQILRGGGGPPRRTQLTSRTGTLRRYIRVDRRPGIRDVGTDLVYGPVHEFGSRTHPRRPFLAPALEAEAAGFDDILSRELQELIDRA